MLQPNACSFAYSSAHVVPSTGPRTPGTVCLHPRTMRACSNCKWNLSLGFASTPRAM